jgi:sulfonate transport system permease protein
VSAGGTTLTRPSPAADEAVVLTVDERPLRRRLGPGPRRRFVVGLGPILVLGLWCLASWSGWLSPQTLSPPWTVLETARHLIDEGRLQTNLLVSARRAFLGLLLGTSAGVLLALFSGLTRTGEALIDANVQFKRAIPALALMPLLILWLGIGEEMKVVTIALGVFVPIYLQTHAGLRAIESRYVELAQTVDLSQWEFLRRVVFPGTLPYFLLGLRFAVTAAWLALVVVEQYNATSGIGYMMELARTYGQVDVILVGLVVYGLLGMASDAAVRLLQRKALAWQVTMTG